MTTVSVIIPTYNRAHYVRSAIESILAQTYQNCEIIVVDDGSTDDTDARLRGLPGNVIYHRQPHSGRPAVGRNTGLRLATGEFVAFLDSDDLFVPDRLALHVAKLEAEPQIAMVYSDAEYFTDDGTIVGTLMGDAGLFPFLSSSSSPNAAASVQVGTDRPIITPSGSTPKLTETPAQRPPQGRIFGPLLISNFIPTCSVTLRHDYLNTVGIFDETPILAGVEDYDLWLRIAAAYEIGHVPGTLSRVRVHGQNISGGDKLSQYLGMLEILTKIGRLHAELVAVYGTRWRERRSLMHLAAARAYVRRRMPGWALAQLTHAILVDPDPSWLAYLLITRHPARQWLERAMRDALNTTTL